MPLNKRLRIVGCLVAFNILAWYTWQAVRIGFRAIIRHIFLDLLGGFGALASYCMLCGSVALLCCDVVDWVVRASVHSRPGSMPWVYACIAVWVGTIFALTFPILRPLLLGQPVLISSVEMRFVFLIYCKTLRYALEGPRFFSLLSCRVDADLQSRREQRRKPVLHLCFWICTITAYSFTRREELQRVHRYASPMLACCTLGPLAFRVLQPWLVIARDLLEACCLRGVLILLRIVWHGRGSGCGSTDSCNDGDGERETDACPSFADEDDSKDVCPICLGTFDGISSQHICASVGDQFRRCPCIGGTGIAIRSRFAPHSLTRGCSQVMSLPCGHRLHTKCAEELASMSTRSQLPLKCPTCRARWLCRPEHLEPEQRQLYYLGFFVCCVACMIIQLENRYRLRGALVVLG